MTRKELEEAINTPTPVSVEPGQPFRIGYGNGKSVEVVALSLRGQKKLAAAYAAILSAETSGGPTAFNDAFELVEAALRLSLPNVTDEFLETINSMMACEIVSKHLSGQALTNDDRKKSE